MEIYICVGHDVVLKKFHSEIPMLYKTPEWGFPKGRRELYESDLKCAVREFEEETGFTQNMYSIIDKTKYYENFDGSNNLRYRHIYYIGHVNESELNKIKNTSFSSSEISSVKWKTYEDAITCIRPYNIEKKKILQLINKRMLTYYKNRFDVFL